MRFAVGLFCAAAGWTALAVDYGPLCSSAKRAVAKNELRVAYLGASITCGERASDKTRLGFPVLTNEILSKALQVRVDHYNACVGSAQSTLGLALLQQVILPWKPDLIFVEYGVLDGFKEAASVPATEQMLRVALGQNIPVVLIAVSTKEPEYTSRAWMLFLSSYYDVPIADQKRFLDQQKIAFASTSPDGTHPNDAGHRTLASAIEQVVVTGLKLENCPSRKPLPEPYSATDYSKLKFAAAGTSGKQGVGTVPQTVFTKAGPAVVIGKTGGAVELAFSGPLLQLLFANGKSPAAYSYQVDGGRDRIISSPSWRQHHVLESGLAPGKHRVRIRFPPGPQDVVLEGLLLIDE